MPVSAPASMLPSILRDYAPEIGIVLGSGLGGFAETLAIDGELPYSDIEGLPVSTVAGHSGKFLTGTVAGKRLLIAQGRTHLYEGHSAEEVTAGVRLMAEAGIHTLILTNAAGTLNPDMRAGEWMAITDHLNLTGASPLVGGAHFVDMSRVYDRQLRQTFLNAANAQQVTLFSGVYAGVLGPQYETPAEVSMLAGLGADAVGMSTVLEAIQARALGLRVAGFSCLTNWAAGISEQPLSHDDVLDTGKRAATRFLSVLKRALTAQWPAQTR